LGWIWFAIDIEEQIIVYKLLDTIDNEPWILLANGTVK
jgi:hypothetical protein